MNKYGISDTEYKIIMAQVDRRKKYRQEFLKQRTNPYLHAKEAGHVFDPALQRWSSMKATQLEFFKPTLKNGVFSFSITILPMLVIGYMVWEDRRKFSEDCLSGKLRYRDRLFKFQ